MTNQRRDCRHVIGEYLTTLRWLSEILRCVLIIFVEQWRCSISCFFDGLYDHVLIRSECQHGGRVAYCAFSCTTPDEFTWFAVRSPVSHGSQYSPEPVLLSGPPFVRLGVFNKVHFERPYSRSVSVKVNYIAIVCH